MRLVDYFDRGFELNPDGACVIDAGDGSSLSYREVRQLTLKGGQALVDAGFSQGAKGAVLSPNHPLAVAATLSLMRSEVTWVPLNPRNSKQDNAYILDAFDCDILFYHSQFADIVNDYRRDISGLKLFVCLDREDGDNPAFLDWLADQPEDDIPHAYNPEGMVMMAGTGGTTGQPKGVMQTHRSLEMQVLIVSSVVPFRKPPVYYAVAPLTHAAGYLVYPVFARGGCIVVEGKPDTQAILAAIPRFGVTMLFLPPTLIYLLLAEREVRNFDYSSLEYFIYGAAPMSPARLAEAIDVFGPVMTQMFGQTESLFPLTFLAPEDHFVAGEIAPAERLRTCGRVAPGIELAIMDDAGNLLPDGETGEIVVRSQMMMTGYYKSPEATEEAFRHGWYHTGDVGYRDADGFYFIVDRAKDMIITGGFNVYSTEVEAAIMSLDAVRECCVIGVPDEKWGEAIKAVVELKPDRQIAADEVIAHCKDQIGSVKAPKSVDFIDEIPRSAVGKVLKRELRATYWQDRDRQVG